MPKNELEIQDIPDYLKEYTIETPADSLENLEEKLDAITPQESVGDLEALKRELDTETKVEPEEVTEVDETKAEKPKKIKEAPKVEVEEVEYDYKPLIETMAEFGILDVAEGDEYEGTAEDLVEKFESTVNKRVLKGLEDYKESIPELGKQFLDYLEQGGDPKKFVEAQSAVLDYDNLDITDEDNQKAVIKEWLKAQDYSNEEIKETLQDYEDSLLLEKQAKLAVKKLEKLDNQRTQLLVREQEQQAQVIENQIKEYVTGVQTFIKGSNEIAGLAINANEKQVFEDYLFKKDKSGLTQYQKDINEDPQKTQIELAFIKFKKYDFSKVAKKAESTAAQKIRKSILTKNEGTVQGMSKDTTKTSDISAFEKMFKAMRKD